MQLPPCELPVARRNASYRRGLYLSLAACGKWWTTEWAATYGTLLPYLSLRVPEVRTCYHTTIKAIFTSGEAGICSQAVWALDENVACTMQMHGTTAPPATEANSRPTLNPSTLSPVVHADHWILTTVNMPEDTEDPTAPGATAPADTLRCVEDRCDILLYSHPCVGVVIVSLTRMFVRCILW